MKTLRLTLHKPAFDVMLTGEKTFEIRKPSRWIKSRLFDKDGNHKIYDCVHFTQGYGKNRPFFVAKCMAVCEVQAHTNWEFSNGLAVETEPGDYMIVLGNIITYKI